MAGFLDPYSPALYRLLRNAALDAGDRLADVQLCGLLPQLPGTLALLVGLGFRAFSVDPPLVPHLAETAASLAIVEAGRRAEAACGAHTCRELREQLGLPRQPRGYEAPGSAETGQVVAVLDVVCQAPDLHLAESRLREHVQRPLLAPHRAEPGAALGQ